MGKDYTRLIMNTARSVVGNPIAELQQDSVTRLVYVIGRYPELTTTFIEREIETLRRTGGAEVQPLSLRYPLTPLSVTPGHQSLRTDTIYLVPERARDSDFGAFLWGNLRFVILRPLVYFGTLLYLLTHSHPTVRARLKTLFHFWMGVYAAHILRQRDFDHVHAHFIDRAVVVALVIGRLLDKPYSLTAHANNLFTDKILIREKIENARFMVTVSQYNKCYLLETYPGLDPDKIHVLHPWVDIEKFVPPYDRPFRECLHILSVGRLVEKKGHTDLIKACHQLQQWAVDFDCRILGSGPHRSKLEEEIGQYDLTDRVHLMGGQPQSEVLQALSSWADVFVLPCVIARDGDRDGIPVSLAEAMAMELPVIATDIVGIRELVQPGTGLLVPPRDPLKLAHALKTVYTVDPSARTTMGRRGRAVVEAEFDLVKGTAELALLFRESI